MMGKIIFGAIALATATVASASITPTLSGAPVDIGGGQFEWTYDVILTPDQRLESGSYFTIYDFNGLVGLGSAPVNWTYSSALIGVTPSLVLPGDDASVFNATFTYTGPTVTPVGLQAVDLGDFSLISTLSALSQDFFTSRAIRNQGPDAGTEIDTIGFVSVPGIPEPQSWIMLIAGFGLVGAAARRRKAHIVAA